MSNQDDFNTRLKRVQDAIALKEPDRLPMIPMVNGLPYALYKKGSHRADYYGFEENAEPYYQYHREFQPDVAFTPMFQSGRANEIAQSNMIDWPGKPGSTVPDSSTYQVIEREYMTREEYDEAIHDFTGFLFNKLIPRSYPGLKGLAGFNLAHFVFLGTWPFANMMSDETLDALDKLRQMAEESKLPNQVAAKISQTLGEMGFPPLFTGIGEVPFDTISDYLRGTAGMFDDQMECPEKVAALCEVVRRHQMAKFDYFKVVPMPVKCVFFPLHKGMDGFMSPDHYAELYWKPYQQILRALVNMGVTPYIYTEGKYSSRVEFVAEQLKEFPGKCLVHIEEADFLKVKKAFTGVAAFCGGLHMSLLEWGKKQEVIDRMKWLIDNCAAGGGYLFDTAGSIENAKRENIEAMFETARTYGAK